MSPAGGADVMRCAWSLATWLWPPPAAAVGIALRRLDTQLQLQALLDGRLWRITLRELSPVIASATMICAVLAFQEFSVYEPTGISVVATEVRMVFETGAFSSPDNPITQQMGFSGGAGSTTEAPANQAARAGSAVATSIPLLALIALLSAIAALAVRKLSADEHVDLAMW